MADTTIRGLTGGDSGQPAADAWLISQATSTATTPLAHSFSAMGGMVHAANTLTTGNLTASVGTLHLLTIAGLTANKETCAEQIEWSMSMVTSLAPVIGYDRASQVAKQAVNEGKTVRQVCQESNILPSDELDRLLDPTSMLAPK